MPAGILYVVATPIGNLEDITLRAIRVLKEVSLIAAEDTRHTQILLSRYDIHTPLTSYHEHNERTKAQPLVERIVRGESIALLSDAGTPAISDPGYRLVVEAVRAGVRIVPLPGPSAVAAVLSASGLPTDRFVFEGFLPAKKQERRAKLQALRNETRTVILYEAPHRVKESLVDMQLILGDREIVIGREVSKVHEEFLRGMIGEILVQVADREVKGEITIVVRGSSEGVQVAEEELKAAISQLAAGGMGVKPISEFLSQRYQLSKRKIYQMALQMKGSTGR
ncbi:MAG: 16S rRNA (cytidine(1402)-2'-O)-methyltransferase [Deltaproteobacteria bacterium]|nr:MAG: 16S rRNA (cytidine(1402)-2'-O)-methyltransferase [Deltaproteobacteria bacterium]